MFFRTLPPLDYLEECFEICDGFLIWKVRPRRHFQSNRGWNGTNSRCAGRRAGTRYGRYEMIWLDGQGYPTHRLIWFMVTGLQPDFEIDHRDGDTFNNRFSNFRPADRFKQNQNRAIVAGTASGLKGVSWHRHTKKWAARVAANGTRIHLGYFSCKHEAFAACEKARSEMHGDFAFGGDRQTGTPLLLPPVVIPP